MSTVPQYSSPSPDDIRAALARLGKLQLRRMFYSKLDNPNWVKALANEGAFHNPPQTIVMPDGMVRSDPWPEIDYLVRMAPLVSGDVADVLVLIAHSDNQWLRRGIMEAGTMMAPADVARLVSKIKEWPDQPLGNFRIDPEDIALTIVRLLTGGQHSKGVQLAEAYFKPRPAVTTPASGTPEPTAGIEPYWYAEELPRIVSALGNCCLPILMRWLKNYQEYSNSYLGNPGSDMSYIWRPSIRNPSEYHTYNIGDSLIDAVRTRLAELTEVSTESISIMLSDEQPLFRRIALDVLADAIDNISKDSEVSTGALVGHQADLMSVAANALSDETLLEHDYKAEFTLLIGACLRCQSGIDSDLIVAAVRLGPPALRDDRRSRFAEADDTPEQVEVRLETYKRNWQHRLLTTLGAESLSGELAEMLADLNSEFGAIDLDDIVLKNNVWIGPTSPLDADAIRAMSDDELIEHLNTWHPDPAKWMSPSHEGQGRILTDALSTQPGRLTDRISDLKLLRPTYIRSVVRSWKIAIEAGQFAAWPSVISICEWASQLQDDLTIPAEGGSFDDDDSYRNLKFEVLQLIVAALADRSNNTGDEMSARLAAIIARFTQNSEPTPDYESKYGGTNMDPLTLSLNTMRPVAIRALIRLVSCFPETSGAKLALEVLDRHIGGRDSSLAVAAAVGEGTGRLYNSVRVWLEERVELIFGDEQPLSDYHQVALSSALAIHRVHITLIELLRRPLMLAIGQMGIVETVEAWRSFDRTFPQLIGDWLVISLIRGQLEYDDPLVVAWFENANSILRGEVLGHLGWQIMKWENVPQDVLQRAAALWDLRMEHVRDHIDDKAELLGAYWFTRSDKYEPSWWLPRLEYVTSVIQDYEMHGMVGERLAAAATIDPSTSLRILENVLMGEAGGLMHYDLLEHAVPQVIAIALDNDDPSLQKRATDLMNQLGNTGYIDLKQRVEKLRGTQLPKESI